MRNSYSDKLPKVVVIDETSFKIGSMNFWFWFVIDPETRKLTNLACKRLVRG